MYFLETLQVRASCHGGVLYSFWYWWNVVWIFYEFFKYWKKLNFQYFMFSSRFMLFPTVKKRNCVKIFLLIYYVTGVIPYWYIIRQELFRIDILYGRSYSVKVAYWYIIWQELFREGRLLIYYMTGVIPWRSLIDILYGRNYSVKVAYWYIIWQELFRIDILYGRSYSVLCIDILYGRSYSVLIYYMAGVIP